MFDSKVKKLSDMSWKQREESGTWQREQVIQELRSQGKCMTKQRVILLDVILSGKWNCCKEICYGAAKYGAVVGMATVYRMVSTLEEIGIFSRCYRYSLPNRLYMEEQAGDWMDQIRDNAYDRGGMHSRAHDSSVFFVRYKWRNI